MKNYYLHRISQECECSYPLADLGFLTIGWAGLSQTGITIDNFDEIMTEEQITSRNRFSLKHFLSMKKGDVVLVPLFDKKCRIFEVTDAPQPITALSQTTLTNWRGQPVHLTEKGLACDEKHYDLGFFLPVRPISDPILRNLAKSALIARMKVQQTTVLVNDLAEEIDALPTRKKKQYLSQKESMAQSLLDDLIAHCSPQDLERVIYWYMEKLGGTPHMGATHFAGKKDFADADVICEFERIQVIIHVQAKLHKGQTDSWSVQQVVQYTQQMAGANPEFTYLNWVITTAEFDPQAIELGKSHQVTLINGLDFALRLLDVGLFDLEQFLESNT